jgi:hypothetical protein
VVAPGIWVKIVTGVVVAGCEKIVVVAPEPPLNVLVVGPGKGMTKVKVMIGGIGIVNVRAEPMGGCGPPLAVDVRIVGVVMVEMTTLVRTGGVGN